VTPLSRPAPAAAVDRAPTFENYVNARGSALLKTAWLLTGDHQRAEDLVQTALSKTWPRWDQIRDSADGAYDAYVRRVMLTTYIAWWRRRWTGESPTAQLPDQPLRGDGEEAAVQRRDLMRALATLPRGQRAVLVLRYFEDLTEAQTADALGCSVGTVKSQSARGLAAMRISPSLTVKGAHHV
jgi:RNA polymerase sigma-70 factor (sigma-E family)